MRVISTALIDDLNDERIKIALEKVVEKITNKQLNMLNIETAINKLLESCIKA